MNAVSVELSKASLEFDRFLNWFILTGAPNGRQMVLISDDSDSDSDSDSDGNNIAQSRH